MTTDILITGFGIIGFETLYEIVNKFKSKKLKIAIIDKNFLNFPGGIAYSKNNSKFGFFNNPLRLSSHDFKSWIKKPSNQIRLIKYFKNEKNLNLDKWLDLNVKKNNSQFDNLKEIYLPRLTYSIFLEEKFKKIIKILDKNKNLVIHYFENQLIENSKEKNKYVCTTSYNLNQKKINYKNKKIFFNKYKKRSGRTITTNNVILGLGILPPKNVNNNNHFNHKNYIHDFYESGGTSFFLDKIKKIKNKKINIVFIGNKAGLLETMQQVEELNKEILDKIKIISISPSNLTLEKAELSKKYLSYKFKFLTKSNIAKIEQSNEILSLIKSEFNLGKKLEFNKYDVWTFILKKNKLDECFKKLSSNEKKTYHNETFAKLRNLTRYTYPETVDAKIRLEKEKILKSLKDRVITLKKFKNQILVETLKSGGIVADIVVNVSGPVSLPKNTNEVPLLNSLKKMNLRKNDRGFISDRYFQIAENIYSPGTLSSNFNPERKTIIRSVTDNCKIAVKHIVKSL